MPEPASMSLRSAVPASVPSLTTSWVADCRCRRRSKGAVEVDGESGYEPSLPGG